MIINIYNDNHSLNVANLQLGLQMFPSDSGDFTTQSGEFTTALFNTVIIRVS